MIAELTHALKKRQHLLTDSNNTARLIDGAGDALDGIYLETYADRWLVSTTTAHLPHELKKWLVTQGHSTYYKQLDQHQKQSPIHLCGPIIEQPFLAKENGVNYEFSFQSGYSQGIFLDQRDNRQRILDMDLAGKSLLNTFAYTGAFSVCAALAGATTTTLDLSPPYLEWAKRNFTHNQLDPSTQHFCKGDTFHWLNRFHKQGRKFNAIILDPPTFSRDEKGKTFQVELHYSALAALALRCLHKNGWILCSTNCKKLSTRNFTDQLKSALATSSRTATLTSTAMPTDFTAAPYLKSIWLQT